MFTPARVGKVNLTKYVNLGDDQWRYCAVVVSSNGRVKQDHVLVNGAVEVHTEGTYCIEWYEGNKRKRQSVSRNAADAQAARHRQVQLLANKAHGIEVVGEVKRSKVMLADVCSEFLEEVQQQRKPKTYLQYRTALLYFQQSCGLGKRLSEIERKDMMAFIKFLEEEKKLSRRTMWTKVAVVMQLLKAQGVSGLLKKRDWPRFTQVEPEIYSPEELKTFFSHCNPAQRAVYEFFLMSGFREAEVQYTMWSDVDFKSQVVRVTAKPDFRFTPKTWEEREVPIPDCLVATLKKHKASLPTGCRLVFPTENGRPIHHLLRMCKSIAWRAGLNCGNCDNGEELCATGPYCGHWYLHKFRATFATMHLQSGVDLRTVQHWMGHKDLASTMRYLKPARGKGVLAKVNATFATA